MRALLLFAFLGAGLLKGALITTVPITLTTSVGDSITIGSTVLELGAEFTVPLTISVSPATSERALNFVPEGQIANYLFQPILTDGVETGFLNWRVTVFIANSSGWRLAFGQTFQSPFANNFNVHSMLDGTTGATFSDLPRYSFQGALGDTLETSATFTLYPAPPFTLVPEPSTCAMVGVAWLFLVRRRLPLRPRA